MVVVRGISCCERKGYSYGRTVGVGEYSIVGRQFGVNMDIAIKGILMQIEFIFG